jgi:hypothetical protein
MLQYQMLWPNNGFFTLPLHCTFELYPFNILVVAALVPDEFRRTGLGGHSALLEKEIGKIM